MTGKIFRSCFLVGLAMMVLCTALFLVVMTNKHEQTVYAEMRQEMRYVRHGLEQSGKDYLTTLTGTQERLTWVAKDGTVLYDSVADPATMENHADRAEIRQAEQEGSCKRRSTTPSAWTTGPSCVWPACRRPWGSFCWACCSRCC